jgi:hypothetical protein
VRNNKLAKLKLMEDYRNNDNLPNDYLPFFSPFLPSFLLPSMRSSLLFSLPSFLPSFIPHSLNFFLLSSLLYSITVTYDTYPLRRTHFLSSELLYPAWGVTVTCPS